MKIVYVNSKNAGVTEAQVFSLIEYYWKIKKFEDIILLQGFKNKSDKKVLERKLIGFKPKVIWFRSWPEYTVFQNFVSYSISKILDTLTLDEQTIFHVKGELYRAKIYQYLCTHKSNAKLLVDLRGVTLEELDKYYLSDFLRKRNKILLFKKAYKIINKNVNISVVSEAFKEYLIERHEFQDKYICVHPNIAGEQFAFSPELRDKIRKELGFAEDDIVAVCSSSGGGAWQKDKEIIMSLIALKVKVINLSTDKQELPGVVNMLVPFKSMPAYLASADIAILWRDNNIVNEVASPSKFSEFAAMGLWVIHNGTVRIATEYILRNNAGFIVESKNNITDKIISLFSNYDRTYYSNVGREAFGVEKVANSYILQYENILQKEGRI